MQRALSFIIIGGLFALAGCAELYPPTANPDYTIKVSPATNGYTAAGPNCPGYVQNTVNPFDNAPMPQFGCATARNLAGMVENPGDLLKGEEMGPARGVTTAGAMVRYENNQTRGLIYPASQVDTSVDVTTAPSAASTMTGNTLTSPSSSGSTSPTPSAAPAGP